MITYVLFEYKDLDSLSKAVYLLHANKKYRNSSFFF